MAWVSILDQVDWYDWDSWEIVSLPFEYSGGDWAGIWLKDGIPEQLDVITKIKITATAITNELVASGSELALLIDTEEGEELLHSGTLISGELCDLSGEYTLVTPIPIGGLDDGDGGTEMPAVYLRVEPDGEPNVTDITFSVTSLEVFLGSAPAPTPPPSHKVGYDVYELEKGWSFDGGYIPHFLELNWYFGDNPVTYHAIQKIRVHGLTKGRTFLQVSTNGMQTDYTSDYSEPQYIDLPRTPVFVNPEFTPVTNYTDTANRGLSIQMKFEGRNTDVTLPEPAHVLQVLVVQSTPGGARAN